VHRLLLLILALGLFALPASALAEHDNYDAAYVQLPVIGGIPAASPPVAPLSTDPVRPGPVNLQASPGNGVVVLFWEHEPNAPPHGGYFIYRCTDTYVPPTNGRSNCERRGQVGSGISSGHPHAHAFISQADNNHTYYYEISSFIEPSLDQAISDESIVSNMVEAGPNTQPAEPVRGIFYYPWFPQTFTPPSGQIDNPWTKWTPALCTPPDVPTSCSQYDSGNEILIGAHIDKMEAAGIEVAISSWFGQSTPTNTNTVSLLKENQDQNASTRWALYYECEGNSASQGCSTTPGSPNPAPADIKSDLKYIHENYAVKPSYYRDAVTGLPVIFVYNADDGPPPDGTDAANPCEVVERWYDAANMLVAEKGVSYGFTFVFKVFPGYTSGSCAGYRWHQYSPAKAADNQPANAGANFNGSFSISPGYDKQGQLEQCAVGLPCSTLSDANCTTASTTCRAYLRRDLHRFEQNVCTMNSKTTYHYHLITSFNEWGEGHAIEPATEWTDGTAGRFLNVLASHPEGTTCTPPSPTVAAVGDISCSPSSTGWNGGAGDATHCQDEATVARALTLNPDMFIALGDLQYEAGSLADYNSYYQPAWGKVKAVTLPVPGNHEYGSTGAGGYFDYWDNGGTADLQTLAGDQNAPTGQAGERGRGYYYQDLDANSDGVTDWRLIALNTGSDDDDPVCDSTSNATGISCTAGSAQELWLRNTALNNPPRCILAYWHVPRFGSSPRHHGNSFATRDFWQDLLYGSPTGSTLGANTADLVLNGHNHSYERFMKGKNSTSPDPTEANTIAGSPVLVPDPNGIRQITVGSGGKDLDNSGNPWTNFAAGSEGPTGGYNSSDFGVLKLTLNATSYEWQFLRASDGVPLDFSDAPWSCN
jgi:calcineurin-like phosphoesterase family protein/iron/zinc purple acid phosphatase-like protein C